MAECEVRTNDPRGATAALVRAIEQAGGVRVDAVQGVAGAVDASASRWALPNGGAVEIWSDNWTPLSLRGEAQQISALAAVCGLELADD